MNNDGVNVRHRRGDGVVPRCTSGFIPGQHLVTDVNFPDGDRSILGTDGRLFVKATGLADKARDVIAFTNE